MCNMILIMFLYIRVTESEDKYGANIVSEDENFEFGQNISNIVNESTSTLKKDDENIMPYAHNLAKDLMEELKEIAPSRRDAHALKSHMNKHEHIINSCQRDYDNPCPLGFKHEYNKTDSLHKCTPHPNYSGPCIGQDLVYKDMDVQEKISWSNNCLAYWPCIICQRKYSDYCPDGWELVDTSTHSCKAKGEYSGPCKDDIVSFIGYNTEMQKQWTRKCVSWWPCHV